MSNLSRKYEHSTSLTRTPLVVRLNYCSKADLIRLPNIGRARATQIVEYRRRHGPFLTIEDLERVPSLTPHVIDKILGYLDWSFNGYYIDPPDVIKSDARHLGSEIAHASIDLIITSPPYWRKRDYQHAQQIGQEDTPEIYVATLVDTINSWIPLLRPHSSVLLNISDTYRNYSLLGIPEMLGMALRSEQWLIVNQIIWAKPNGIPEPLPDRLASRHEIVLHLTRSADYFADVHALAQHLNQSSNPGDVWEIPHTPSQSAHLAPFPEELVRRMVAFACPEHVCTVCGVPYRRNLQATTNLDVTRPQAQRALELFEQAGLTAEHLEAIRAVGISDAGKGKQVQSGASANADRTKLLARQAKDVLGGYFREFTFAPKRRADWSICTCRARTIPGKILDPFMGSGTSLRIAYQLGRAAVGADLVPPDTIFP